MTELIAFFSEIGISGPDAIFWAAIIGALWRMDNRMTAIEKSILIVSETVSSEKEQNDLRWTLHKENLDEQHGINRELAKIAREMQHQRSGHP